MIKVGKMYCLFVSAFSVFFLIRYPTNLAVPVHFGCLLIMNSLLISALIYAAIFAYLYYEQFMKVDRKADLKRYFM